MAFYSKLLCHTSTFFKCLSTEWHFCLFLRSEAVMPCLTNSSISTYSTPHANIQRTAFSLGMEFRTVRRIVEQGFFSSRMACSAVKLWKLTLLYCKSKTHTKPAFNSCTKWNGQNMAKCVNFQGVLFFQATYYIKSEKQTINSLSLCQFDAEMLAEEKGHLFLLPASHAIFLLPASQHQSDKS